MNIETLPRFFKLGATEIPDPAPGQDLDICVRLLAQNFPQFRQSRIFEEDARVEVDRLVYELILPPPKVNG